MSPKRGDHREANSYLRVRRRHPELAARAEVDAATHGPRLPDELLEEEREGLIGAPGEEDEGQGAASRGVGHLGRGVG